MKGDDRIAGTLPFVTAGEASEGISAYISNEVEVFEKNTTTIDMFGSAKYRNYIYGGDDHIAVVHTENLPKYASIFVTTAIHKSSHNGQFDYGHNFYAKDADALYISLPVNEAGNPDYDKMAIIIAYDSITPVCLTSNGQDQDDYGAYVELTRVFDVVDFDYLERIFSKGGLIEYLKKTEKEKIETTASVATESLNRSQQRSNSNAIRAKIKEAVAASGKQYDGIKEIIDMVRQIIPYNRMLISSDGYLIPLDDRYFRIDAQNLGFKYGGEITCVGMITNIIGEDTDPNDSQNIFATLQFSVNEVLRQLLPTKERNLCVIHPIAVYYGN